MTNSIFTADLQVEQQTAIVGNDETVKKKLAIEADVIVTSVVLGFICTRYYQGQSCQFDYEHPSEELTEWFDALDSNDQDKISKVISKVDSKEVTAEEKLDYIIRWVSGEEGSDASNAYTEYLLGIQDFYRVLDSLAVVVSRQEPDMGEWLQDGQSPFGKEGELITGKKGGEMLSARERATPFRISKALMLRNALETVRNPESKVYQGRGAYTGLVENPLKTDTNVYPTMRVKPVDTERPWPGIDGKQYWGLIRPKGKPNINLDPDPKLGMGPLPAGTDDNTQIGYIHGMCTAIEKSMEEGTCCTPYEMATGEETTKMASCFACSTYMYASGYPPTSTHLGRGESWLPPQPGDRLELADVDGAEDGPVKPTNMNKTLCENLHAKWHLEIHHQLRLGLSCLQRVKEYVEEERYEQLQILEARLQRDAGENIEPVIDKFESLCVKGGNVFLDALTVHDKDADRVKRTLQPLYDILKSWDEKILGKGNV